MIRPLTTVGVIVCRHQPLIYLTIPKCACTTIKNLLFRLETGQSFEEPLAIHEALHRGRLQDAFVSIDEDWDPFVRHRRVSFTFVRNPLPRIYSCFNEKVFYQSPNSFPWVRKRLTLDYGAVFDTAGSAYSAADHSENFKQFLLFVRDNISGKTTLKRDGHWLPQSRIIRRYSSLINIDVVGKVESYESDIDFVLSRAGIADRAHLRTLKFNEGTPAPFSLESVKTDEIRELVTEIYGDDYSMFGYGQP